MSQVFENTKVVADKTHEAMIKVRDAIRLLNISLEVARDDQTNTQIIRSIEGTLQLAHHALIQESGVWASFAAERKRWEGLL